MTTSSATELLQLIGPTGTGKTTLTRLLLEAIPQATVLAIDASPDMGLTRLLKDNPPQTLADVLDKVPSQPSRNLETIDWVFHDLPVPVQDDLDLVTLGDLSVELPVLLGDSLRYGLQRLVNDYQYVIIDGYHAGLSALLPAGQLQTLVVVTPQYPALPAYLPKSPTPAVILNRFQPEALQSASLDYALAQGDVTLIGKLPDLDASGDDLESQLQPLFRNCLLRLDFIRPARL
jgi:energy-coupling factor transporter ATP-binding protein EcfA2